MELFLGTKINNKDVAFFFFNHWRYQYWEISKTLKRRQWKYHGIMCIVILNQWHSIELSSKSSMKFQIMFSIVFVLTMLHYFLVPYLLVSTYDRCDTSSLIRMFC